MMKLIANIVVICYSIYFVLFPSQSYD